jgi:hypothetical protein
VAESDRDAPLAAGPLLAVAVSVPLCRSRLVAIHSRANAKPYRASRLKRCWTRSRLPCRPATRRPMATDRGESRRARPVRAVVRPVCFGRIGCRGQTMWHEFGSETEACALLRRGLRRRRGPIKRCGIAYWLIEASPAAAPLLAVTGTAGGADREEQQGFEADPIIGIVLLEQQHASRHPSVLPCILCPDRRAVTILRIRHGAQNRS